MRYLKLLLAGCSLAIAGGLSAATYHVAPPPAGSDINGGTNWAAPMATISNALAQSDVELVLVSNGLYKIAATITNDKAVTVRGVNTPGQTNTIIDGGGDYRCFWVNHKDAVLDGLQITNGFANAGAGVYISSLGGTVTGCLIKANYVEGTASGEGGAGIWMYGTGAVYNSCIIENIISTNDPDPRGGGIFIRTGPNSSYTVGGIVADCLIAGNKANRSSQGGGGILIQLGIVRGCVISNNSAGSGGGMTVTYNGIVTGCTIAANSATESAGSGGGVYLRDAGSPGALVVDCVISNNRTGGDGTGGGIYLSGHATQIVRNCLITHNWSTNRDGGGVGIGAGTGGALVDGCTIEYNRSDGLGNQGGGGVYVTRSGAAPDDAQIMNCTIRYNQSAKNAGGIILYRGGVVSNCVIEGNLGSTNSSSLGGGIYASQGGLITHSRIVSNNSGYYGGGAHLTQGGTLINCLVAGNVASNHGGGLFADNMIVSNGSIRSCTFADNESVSGYGGGMWVVSTNYFINTIIYSNRASAAAEIDVGVYPLNQAAATNSFHYCCTSRDLSTANQHNTAAPPEFADFAGGNYRLAAGSPCINAGTNESWMAQGFDLDGRPRLDRFSRLPDMGCYEYIPPGTMFRLQ